jgi:hypothetical protein
MKRKSAAIAAVLALAAGLSACATATPYQPNVPGAAVSGGYSDYQLDANKFRVTFAGNTLTSRDTVERYLLYRAAELTLQKGYDNFILVSRDTETRSQTYIDRSFGGPGWGGGPFGYWRPSWRWYRPRFGWRSWDPFFGDPFYDNDFDMRTINRYEATAEIVIGRGAKPSGNVRAFDAHEVVDRLGPTIQMPQPRK